MGGGGSGSAYLAPSVTGGFPPGISRALTPSKMGFISSGVASYLVHNITSHHVTSRHISARDSCQITSKYRTTDQTYGREEAKNEHIWHAYTWSKLVVLQYTLSKHQNARWRGEHSNLQSAPAYWNEVRCSPTHANKQGAKVPSTTQPRAASTRNIPTRLLRSSTEADVHCISSRHRSEKTCLGKTCLGKTCSGGNITLHGLATRNRTIPDWQ